MLQEKENKSSPKCQSSHWCTVCGSSAEMTMMTPAGFTATLTLLFALHDACYQLSFHWLRAPQTFLVSQASQSYQPWESFRTAWIWVLNTLPSSCSLVPAPQKWVLPFKFRLSWLWSVLKNQNLTLVLLWRGWVGLVSVSKEWRLPDLLCYWRELATVQLTLRQCGHTEIKGEALCGYTGWFFLPGGSVFRFLFILRSGFFFFFFLCLSS